MSINNKQLPLGIGSCFQGADYFAPMLLTKKKQVYL